jgi:hypothetical protein
MSVPVWPRVRLVARTIEAALDVRAQLAESQTSHQRRTRPARRRSHAGGLRPARRSGVDRVHQARRVLHRLAAQIHGHGGRDG